MSKVAIQGDPSGSGTFTIAAPNSNSNVNINLPTVTGGNFIVSNASGNVGIGTSSPTARLDVANTSTNTTFSTVGNQLLIRNAGTTVDAYARIDFAGGSANNPTASIAAQIKNYGTGATDIVFGTFNTGAGTIAERARITTDGNFQFNSGYGSVATAFGCRAWVNFNGVGGASIRASGNVSSVARNGTGDYTVNMATALPDNNYVVAGLSREDSTGNHGNQYVTMRRNVMTSSSFRLSTGSSSAVDHVETMVAVFR
jgi:hypothetical protein